MDEYERIQRRDGIEEIKRLRAEVATAREQREQLRQECGDYRRHIEFAIKVLENEGNGQPSHCLDRLRRIVHHYDHLRAALDAAKEG